MRYSFSKISSYVIIKNTNFCFFLKSGSPSFSNSKVKLEKKTIYQAKFLGNLGLKSCQNHNQILLLLFTNNFCSYPNKISTVLVVNKRFKLKTICDKKGSFENNVLAYFYHILNTDLSKWILLVSQKKKRKRLIKETIE